MRLTTVGAWFALALGLSKAESNITDPRESQQVLSGDFKPPQVFENTNLVRNTNLEKGYVRETINVVVTNIDSNPQSEYYVPFEYDVMGKIGGFEVRDKKAADVQKFKVTTASLAAVLNADGSSSKPTQYFVVHFATPLKPKEQITLTISYHILGALSPLPAAIKQDEKQYLSYSFSAYLLSAYRTLKQKTKLKFPSADVPEYTSTTGLTSAKDPEKQGSSFTYGTYDTADVPAGTLYPVTVRYEFNKPLLVCSMIERDVEVSHWGGNLATEERYWLRHDGATLSDHFSRVTWATQTFYLQAGQMVTPALRELKVPLRPGSVDPYFTDDIGNVSTSHFRPNNLRDALLEIRPRYPLFGGWKYSFRLGWNNALSSFVRKLKTPSDSYVLSVPLLEGPKMPEGIQYEHFVFRVILPEGATDIKYEVHGGSGLPELHTEQSLHKTFMDTLGRTELKFTASNVVDDVRDAQVIVTYQYTLFAALRKPISIFVSLVGIFAIAWAVGSIDTSIGVKDKKE